MLNNKKKMQDVFRGEHNVRVTKLIKLMTFRTDIVVYSVNQIRLT